MDRPSEIVMLLREIRDLLRGHPIPTSFVTEPVSRSPQEDSVMAAPKKCTFEFLQPGHGRMMAKPGAGGPVNPSGPFPIEVTATGAYKVSATAADGSLIDISAPGPNQGSIAIVDGDPTLATAVVTPPVAPATANLFTETGKGETPVGTPVAEHITLTFVDPTLGSFTGDALFNVKRTPTGFVTTPA